MRKFKKAAALCAASALSLAVTATAFGATTINERNGSDSRNVTGSYVPGSGKDTVYSVDIVWGSMAFTYTGASSSEWNPATHQYDAAGPGVWSCEEGANKVQVTNHSNTDVTAKFAFSSVKTGIEGAVDLSEQTLASAENKTLDASEITCTATVSITAGELTEADNGVTIGNVTITIVDGQALE